MERGDEKAILFATPIPAFRDAKKSSENSKYHNGYNQQNFHDVEKNFILTSERSRGSSD